MFLYRLQFKHPAYLILPKKWNSRQIVSKHFIFAERMRGEKSIARFLWVSGQEVFFLLHLVESPSHVQRKIENFFMNEKSMWVKKKRTRKRRLNVGLTASLLLFPFFFLSFFLLIIRRYFIMIETNKLSRSNLLMMRMKP